MEGEDKGEGGFDSSLSLAYFACMLCMFVMRISLVVLVKNLHPLPPSLPPYQKQMGMDVIALCDSREMKGVDHVRETGGGKHISGFFQNAPLLDMAVSRGREGERERPAK